MSIDSSDRANKGFATRAIHLGHNPSDFSGALTPPVFMTSTYAFKTAEQGEALFRGERDGYIYGRTRNPTQTVFEQRLASLEGAEATLATASGMGAISATFWALLQSGDRILIDNTLYGNTFAFFMRGLTRFGVTVSVADFGDLSAVEAAVAQTSPKIVFFETPSNPTLKVVDIASVARIAHETGALVVVDNTFATPALQQPLALGADLIVHSATKFLGGHGDLIAGAVVGPRRIVETIRSSGLRLLGATISPLTCFLLLRGLKTLELRMERHSASALAIAELLAEHPTVAWVSYPGLQGSRSSQLACRQMTGFGGLIACELHGGKKACTQFMNSLTLVNRAVSLGDAETLVQHPATMTHSAYTPEERRDHRITDGLIRFSIGLETLDDLKGDIGRALDCVRSSPTTE